MLSAATRVAALRLGSSAVASTTRVTAAVSWQTTLVVRAAVRPFATTGRPKSTTASKTTATKKKTTSTAAKKTAKKPAAKKTVKKAAAKPKPKPKPKAVKKPKKEVDPEKQAIAQRRELKKTALFNEPKGLPSVGWNLHIAESLRGAGMEGVGTSSKLKSVTEAYQNLSASQKDALDSRAAENKAANAVAYRNWVESIAVEDVRKANNARYLLKRKFNYPSGQLKLIKDARQPKEPASAYALFVKAKWAAGEVDNSGNAVSSVASALGAEWKGLSAAEKKPYEDLNLAERERYFKEMKDVFGMDVQAPARRASV